MTPEAFIEITGSFRNKLYRLSLRLLNDADDASDAVQEVYLKLWTMDDALLQYRNPEALAMKMARNHCLDKLKAAVRKMQPLHEVSEIARQNPHNQIETIESGLLVKKFIAALPELQRIIIHLRDIEQYDFDEIEAVTGLNTNAIRVNLSRARKKIREKLTQYHNYGIARN